MCPAKRLTLAILSTAFVLAFCGGIALADAAGDFETLFGEEARKVAASRTKTDDVEFAARLLQTAKDVSDSPNTQILLYEKAVQFASGSVSGCDIALEALALLEQAVPARKEKWRQRKFEIVKFRFGKSYGSAKKTAGKPYMEMLEARADARALKGDLSEAKLLYKRAVAIATYIKSPSVVTILAKMKRAGALVVREAKLKSLHARLKANTRNTSVREELILLYVVAFDKPASSSFQDYLSNWHRRAPAGHKKIVADIIRVFELKVPRRE
jgi:hypothetical protein